VTNHGDAVSEQAPAPLRALVVDDEPPLIRLVTSCLERDGFHVPAAGDGERAVELAKTWAPEVIVRDLMLPRMDGIEACRRIRTFSDAYIVMLTARVEEVDKLVGLGVGADHYLIKLSSPRELVGRIRAMLHRPKASAGNDQAAAPARQLGELVIDPATHEVRIDGQPVELTRLEFDLLEALSGRPRVVLSRRQLLERVWDPDWYGDEHLVDVHIANLRRKLGDNPANRATSSPSAEWATAWEEAHERARTVVRLARPHPALEQIPPSDVSEADRPLLRQAGLAGRLGTLDLLGFLVAVPLTRIGEPRSEPVVSALP
jgi:DNA-binding response OmpR family regulator